MVNRLPPLTVPPIEIMPVQSGNHFDVVSMIDYLIGQLIAVQPAVLDHPLPLNSDIVEWEIRFRTDRDIDTKTIATTSRRHSSGLLARVGHHYLDGQLYGGHAVRHLTCNGITADCHIHLGNSSQSWRWLRIVAGRPT